MDSESYTRGGAYESNKPDAGSAAGESNGNGNGNGNGNSRPAEQRERGDSGGRGPALRDARSKNAPKVSRLTQITADRPIFTLSVAADLLGLHPRTLRIYEEKRLVVPARTEGNRRRYSQNDIQRFQFIRRLTGGGVNLEGVRIILDMADELSRRGGDPNEIIERNLRAIDGEADSDLDIDLE